MNRVRLVTDSACDLPQPLVDELGIAVVPLTIRIDGVDFVDRRDLTPAAFWARSATASELPCTAAPAPGQFAEAYRALADDGPTSIVAVCLSAAARLATALSIKPIIEVRDGKVEQGGKQRTRGKALAFLVDQLATAGDVRNVGVLHAACDDVDRFVAMLREVHDGEIVVGDIGPVVGAHTGTGTIGITFF